MLDHEGDKGEREQRQGNFESYFSDDLFSELSDQNN